MSVWVELEFPVYTAQWSAARRKSLEMTGLTSQGGNSLDLAEGWMTGFEPAISRSTISNVQSPNSREILNDY